MTTRYDDPAHARYLTFGCYRRKHLLALPELTDLFLQHLDQWRKEYSILLLAFVLMPNHVHLLVHTSQPDLGRLLGKLKSLYGRDALGLLRQSHLATFGTLAVEDHGENLHRFWQAGGGYDRNVFSDQAVRKAIDYIHNNPVRAGLVQLPEEYRWSSAKFWLLGQNDPLVIDRPDWL